LDKNSSILSDFSTQPLNLRES
jgi:hypothetical protein